MSYPRGVIPTDPGVRVHPTPVYEMIIFLAIFFALWRLRRLDKPPWWLFAVYLMLAGVERFFIEFIRTNQALWSGLTEAQLVSVVMVAVGAVVIVLLEARLKGAHV
jgi:phosphatidylglycerol:prolipoprotein diacylglycerol transferase